LESCKTEIKDAEWVVSEGFSQNADVHHWKSAAIIQIIIGDPESGLWWGPRRRGASAEAAESHSKLAAIITD